MPTDTATALTNAIIQALPAAALAVLFAIFALVLIWIAVRTLTTAISAFITALREEGTRNRTAHTELAQRWRDEVAAQNATWRQQFSEGMGRFATEMHQMNASIQGLAAAHNSHDKTMQIGFAGLTNAVAQVTHQATRPTVAPAPPSPAEKAWPEEIT